MRLARDDETERRVTSGMRLLLAVTALVVTRIDPSEPSRLVGPTYALLSAYVAFAGTVHLGSLRGVELPPLLEQLLPWGDVGVYVALVGLSGGSNSIFFVLFFFGILVASFRSGFRAGLAITGVSVLLFAVVGYFARPADVDFDLNRFLIRSASLPVLGYMIAYRGGFELRLRRRLALLREIATLSNPRSGAGRLLAGALERLRAFYDADACLAVLGPRGDTPGELRRALRGSPEAALVAAPLPASLAATLRPFADDQVVYVARATRWRGPRTEVWPTPAPGGPDAAAAHDAARSVAGWLGEPAFLSVPLRAGSRTMGRLYLVARRPRFDVRDADFVLQAMDQVVPSLDYLALIERMATTAADDERQRIALDIHDRLIQPYIGLQIGISALDQLLKARGEADVLPLVRERASRLVALAAQGTSDLRQYIADLRRAPATAGGLGQSLRRFAERFSQATGIEVEIVMDDALRVDDRLAAEIFSMAAEGVSNVRRHTNAPRATVRLQARNGQLVLRTENPTDEGSAAPAFTPRSIVERAASVHGSVRVDTTGGTTAVIVEVPL